MCNIIIPIHLFSPTADMEDVFEDFSSNIKSLTQLTTFLLNTFMEMSGGVDNM